MSFRRQLLGRAGLGLLSIWGALTIVFVLGRLTGDPARLMSPPGAPAEQVEQIRRALGFDRSIFVQYGDYLTDAARGDLGSSYYWQQPALELVLDRIWPTVYLAFAAMAFAIIFGIVLGLLAGFFRGRFTDRLLVRTTMLGQAIPSFWLGPVLILLVSVQLGWLPAGGMRDVSSVILPAITLGAFQLALLFRMTRATTIEALGQDYVVMARAKGTGGLRLAASHVLPNTALPTMTLAGLGLASLIGGSVITESIFSWPGVGFLLLQAVQQRDFPVVQSVALLYSVGFVSLNTIVDLLYRVADPRLRSESL